MNWLIVKRLVTLPIMASVPPEKQSFLHELYRAGNARLKWYGLIQNWAFFAGLLFVGLGFAFNLNG